MKRIVLALALASCATAPGPVPAPPATAASPARVAPAWAPTQPPGPLEAKRIPQPRVTREKLLNGLEIVVVEHHARPIVSVALVLPRGTATDPPRRAGLAWLAVTMAEDSYEDGRGDANLGEKSFRREIADLGGTAAFEVGSDASIFHVRGYAAETAAYLEKLADAMRHPRHGKRSFYGRRRFAVSFFEQLESSDLGFVREIASLNAFGKDHPYGRSTYGTADSMSRIQFEEAVERQRAILVPNGGTLLIVGDVKGSRIVEAAKAAFGKWTPGGDGIAPFHAPARQTPDAGTPVGFLERPQASTLMTCATRAMSDAPATRAPSEVLAAIVGGGLGSRLSTALREGNGMTYFAHAEIVRRRHGRAFLACAALRADRTGRGAGIFRGVLDEARTRLPTNVEVQRAKGVLLAELDSTADDVQSIERSWLDALEFGSGTPKIAEERAAIERVTAADVRKVAETMLAPKTMRWLVSGDKKAARAASLGTVQPWSPGS